jgi:hypothetical protein
MGPDGHMFKLGLDLGMESALELGDHAKVEELLSKIDELRPGEITPWIRAVALRTRARLQASQGEEEGVEAGLKEAAGLFREIGSVPSLAATLADLGAWQTDHARPEEGQTAAREAEAIYERLGAHVPLAKLRERVPLEPLVNKGRLAEASAEGG